MDAEQCRSKARQLLICASQMTSPASRAALIDLAATWMRLADLTIQQRIQRQKSTPIAQSNKLPDEPARWSNIVLLAWGCALPIHRLVKTGAFEPEQVAMLREVFEDVLRSLGLVDRADALTDMVAKTVIAVAQTGERDRVRLKQSVLKAFE
jgi:hypothetical protein